MEIVQLHISQWGELQASSDDVPQTLFSPQM